MLNSVVVPGAVFAIAVGAALFGATLGPRLPKDHLSGDSRDVIKLVLGLVATMAALVLGLLIASSKSFYDTQSAELQTQCVDIVRLDAALAEYGPETRDVRARLRQGVEDAYRNAWPQGGGPAISIGAGAADQVASLARLTRALSPQTERQRQLQSEAITVASAIGSARLLMLQQVGNALSWPLLTILVFWIALLFLGFGLFTRLNATVTTALVMGGLSVASAIFLILQMSMPYAGLVRLSPAPIVAALAQIGG